MVTPNPAIVSRLMEPAASVMMCTACSIGRRRKERTWAPRSSADHRTTFPKAARSSLAFWPPGAFPDGGKPLEIIPGFAFNLEHHIHAATRFPFLRKGRRDLEIILEDLRDGSESVAVSRKDAEKTVQEDEDAQGAGIDDAGGFKLRQEFRRGEHRPFESLEHPFPPGRIERRRTLLHGLRQRIEDGQHRALFWVVHRLPGPVPPLPDGAGEVSDRIGHEEAGEKPRGDVSGISPGRQEQLPDDPLPPLNRLPQGVEADHEVPSRIAVGHGKDVDLIQEVRPGGDPFEACHQGLRKRRFHL
jgi:hypothetical protein